MDSSTIPYVLATAALMSCKEMAASLSEGITFKGCIHKWFCAKMLTFLCSLCTDFFPAKC